MSFTDGDLTLPFTHNGREYSAIFVINATNVRLFDIESEQDVSIEHIITILEGLRDAFEWTEIPFEEFIEQISIVDEKWYVFSKTKKLYGSSIYMKTWIKHPTLTSILNEVDKKVGIWNYTNWIPYAESIIRSWNLSEDSLIKQHVSVIKMIDNIL